MKHIEDEPVNLNEIDLLAGKRYSEMLRDIISKNDNKSMTIGLFGEWGSGKSSIVETTKINFENDEKVKFIKYDAWKYTNDNFRRTFLIEIQKDLKSKKVSKKELENNLYSTVIKNDYNILIIVGCFILFFVSVALLNHFGFESKYSIVFSFIIAALSLLFQFSFLFLKGQTQTQSYFSPEQFENDFQKMVGEYFLKNSSGKLIFIIDNIDRCTLENAYQLLGNIKGFLDIKNSKNKCIKNKSVIFLIPISDLALRKKIE
ncbi:hypothetical protein MsAg5_04480 [Methanosarcinaceae archaeon Ag5]|uniref:KAP NTPase domain-containing protein n=1 Tax=Methanolapillus africanus TaxID=3028297 RepID=A0AAE4SCK7_9EURY|nr:hypothetical protein [Methanosarcinaceae archaeon Ag5]